MRPEDTQEGRAILQEQAYLDSYEGAVASHSDPKDKIIADLLEALRAVEAHHVEQNGLKHRPESKSTTLRIVRAAIAAAKVGQ